MAFWSHVKFEGHNGDIQMISGIIEWDVARSCHMILWMIYGSIVDAYDNLWKHAGVIIDHRDMMGFMVDFSAVPLLVDGFFLCVGGGTLPFICIYIYIHTMWTPEIVNLIYNSHCAVVNDTYSYSINGDFRPTNITGDIHIIKFHYIMWYNVIPYWEIHSISYLI